MSDKIHGTRGSEGTSTAKSQNQSVSDRPYNLHVHKNTMYGLTVDRNSGYATAGYENKKNVFLQGSTDKQAAYAVLEKTFK